MITEETHQLEQCQPSLVPTFTRHNVEERDIRFA